MLNDMVKESFFCPSVHDSVSFILLLLSCCINESCQLLCLKMSLWLKYLI
jgi:hypothetical protein